MTFLTPCFVRVDDAAERQKLIEWLMEIGHKSVIANDFEVMTIGDGHIDCGTNVDLFRALAAMNDENDREQWFVGNNGEYVKCTDDNFFMFAINVLQKQKRKTGFVSYRKATAEEIISYLKNK